MKRYSYSERDYAFGQLMLTLRTTIGLTQAGLAERLGVSRRAVAEWEAGSSYPKVERLRQLIELGVQQQAFPVGREAEEIRALWRAAHQKVLLDERWLHDLVAPPVPLQLFQQAEKPFDHAAAEPEAFSRVNLVEALDVSHFACREVEVAELSQWILEERCRLVTLLGMGGIGKSMLASYLGLRLAPQFEAVLWRSVRDAPSCEELVADCITFFSQTPPAEFPASLEQRITQLLSRLQAHRCLLVLDNLESLLESGDSEGGYLPGYECYGRLIQRLGESAHRSCVLLTSREKSKEIEPLEGTRSPVRSLRLSGLNEQTAQELLSDKELSGTPAAWQRLVDGYAGNPLALKIVAQAVSDLFGGDLDRFLQEGELVFNGVRPVLRQQVGRLSPLEHQLLTWLAVLREWTTLDTLSQVLHPRVRRAQLLEALEALLRRSLLERGQQASFGLQSVVMEYLSDELSERLAEEIVRGEPQLLRRVALAQAQAKDYVREIQMRLLVQPLLERLRAELGAHAQIEAHLLRLLTQFRSEDAATQGYGPANVITLLIALRGHLRGLDLSRLFIRGAYLQNVEMQDVTLSGARLEESVLTEAFDAIWAVAISQSGQYWAAAGRRGEVRVWRVEQEVGQTLHRVWQAYSDIATTLAFSPDERLLASGSTNGSVKLWDVESGAALWSVWRAKAIACLAFSPDGSLLASGGLDATVRLWDPQLGTHLEEVPHPGLVSALAWSPDGKLLACATVSSGLLLWEAGAGSLRWIGREMPVWIRRVVFSPDGKCLVGGGDDGKVYMWDASDGRLLLRLGGHQGAVMSVAWSPDGTLLASGGGSLGKGEVFVWDASTGACLYTLNEPSGSVYALAWNPGGTGLLSGGSDGRLRWWIVHSGQCIRVREAHQGTVQALKVSPDNSKLASCGDDGAIMLWDLESGHSLGTLRRDRPYERMNISSVQGLTVAQKASLLALGAVRRGEFP